jgi:hypothetical protein
MQHKPRRFLGDTDVLGELGAGDAILVRRDKPDRHEPFPHGDFRVLENRSHLDRKPLATVAAFVGALVREMVDFGGPAMGAKGPVFPPDGRKMVYGRLFVRDRRDQFD